MRVGLIGVVCLFGWLASGCESWCDDCGGSWRCDSDADCPPLEEGRQFCDLRSGGCVLETRECANTFECCAGQRCLQGVFCADHARACETDAECEVPGQGCRSFSAQRTLGSTSVPEKGCVFQSCTAASGCAEGLTCFDGVCVGANPCEGGCPVDQVCVPLTNECFDVGTGVETFNRWAASCHVSCAEGSMLVFAAPTNLFNRCNPALVGCRCLPTPF